MAAPAAAGRRGWNVQVDVCARAPTRLSAWRAVAALFDSRRSASLMFRLFVSFSQRSPASQGHNYRLADHAIWGVGGPPPGGDERAVPYNVCHCFATFYSLG